jgi:hypothetical protein
VEGELLLERERPIEDDVNVPRTLSAGSDQKAVSVSENFPWHPEANLSKRERPQKLRHAQLDGASELDGYEHRFVGGTDVEELSPVGTETG